MSRWWRTRGSSGRAAGIGLRAVPADDSRTPRRRGQLARVGRGLVGAFVALTLMVGTLAAVSLATAPAKAFDFACAVGGGDAANVGPETEGLGSSFWLPKKRIPGSNERGIKREEYRATLWEVAGTRGLLWSYSPKVPTEDARQNFNIDDSQDSFEDACSPVDASAGYVAQLMFEPSRFLGGLTIGLKEMAVGNAPFESFYQEGERLIDVFRTAIFQPALVVGVIAAGLWALTRFRRQDDQRETYSGIIWSAAIVVGVSALLFGGNFRTLTEYVDRQVSAFNAAALESTARLTERGNQADTSPCLITETTTGPDWEQQEEAEQEGARRTSCLLYELLLYNPWSLGQFGTSTPVTVPDLCYDRNSSDEINCDPRRFRDEEYSTAVSDGCIYSPYRCDPQQRPIRKEDARQSEMGINLAIQQVVAQAYTNNEVIDGARENPNGADDEYTSYDRLWQQVQFAVADRHPDKYTMWKGSEPTSRMATAVSTALINVIMLLAVGLIALLTVFWHGVMFVAWFLLPVVGAVAAFPPARRIFVGYVGIVVQAVFLRMVLGLVLAVLLGIMSAINLSTGNTGLKIILMIIAAAAMWKLLTSLRSGQMGPSVVSTAGDQGMLPSDRVAERGTGAVRYAQRRWERRRDISRYRRRQDPRTPQAGDGQGAQQRRWPQRRPAPTVPTTPNSPNTGPTGGGQGRPEPPTPPPTGGDGRRRTNTEGRSNQTPPEQDA